VKVIERKSSRSGVQKRKETKIIILKSGGIIVQQWHGCRVRGKVLKNAVILNKSWQMSFWWTISLLHSCTSPF